MALKALEQDAGQETAKKSHYKDRCNKESKIK